MCAKDTTIRIKRQSVLKAIAEYFDIDQNSLFERTQKPAVVYPRQIAAYMLSLHCGYTRGDIGMHLGGWERSTIHYYIKTIDRRLSVEQKVNEDLLTIQKMFSHELSLALAGNA